MTEEKSGKFEWRDGDVEFIKRGRRLGVQKKKAEKNEENNRQKIKG